MINLGLAPDLSRLSWETLELIKHGTCEEHRSLGDTRLEVCVEMIHVGYGADEIWTVMTDPANGISREFFERSGEEAEDFLEQLIFEAHAAVERPEGAYG